MQSSGANSETGAGQPREAGPPASLQISSEPQVRPVSGSLCCTRHPLHTPKRSHLSPSLAKLLPTTPLCPRCISSSVCRFVGAPARASREWSFTGKGKMGKQALVRLEPVRSQSQAHGCSRADSITDTIHRHENMEFLRILNLNKPLKAASRCTGRSTNSSLPSTPTHLQ